MERQSTSIMESLKGRFAGKCKTDGDETRPVKWIKESENVWRIVYADGNQAGLVPNEDRSD